MTLPPLGTRWADLTPEQRAALPVGTVLGHMRPTVHVIVKTQGGWSFPDFQQYGPYADHSVDLGRTILSYPKAP